MREKTGRFIKSGKAEGWFWLIAIAVLAMSNPDGDGHFSLCLFKNLGFHFCPGCGLGHAIALLFRARLSESVMAHPLAIPAIIVLGYRSIFLLTKHRCSTEPYSNTQLKNTEP